ncbi:MAG: PH domain-containing protein, partial [Rothia sp. (in: high G+C Gram-positive bacteria)]|nr:PH domain-containing protein [Rothia sp. (in: high G+C Gram-positive bacteria)]
TRQDVGQQQGAPWQADEIQPAEEKTLTWRRAHPLSPLVRSWLLIVAFLFAFVRPAVEDIFSGEESITFDDLANLPVPQDGPLRFLEIFGSYWLLVAVLLVFLLALVPFFSTWFFYRFALDDRNVYIKSGMLFKSERKARLDRVQSIDLNRPLVARLLGLAELKFDVADGAASALAVQYLKYSDARDLRERLLSQVRQLRAGGKTQEQDVPAQQVLTGSLAGAEGEPGEASTAEGKQLRQRLSQHVTENFVGVTGADEQQIIHVPVARLIGSMFLSMSTVVTVLAVLAFIGLMFWAGMGVGAVFASNVALILGLVSAIWKRFNTGFNFRLSTSPDGLKTRFGFTDTVTKTVPEGRIQMISVTQPLLWRIPGWYKVGVSLAGQDAGESSSFAGELLPVGTRDDLLRILPLVVADETAGGASAEQLQAGLEAKGDGHGFTATPLGRSWRKDWLAVSRKAFALTPALLLVRSGITSKKLKIVPHSKVQSLKLSQGPWGKRYGYADLEVSTAAGGQAHVDLLDAEVARAFLVRQAQLGVQMVQDGGARLTG